MKLIHVTRADGFAIVLNWSCEILWVEIAKDGGSIVVYRDRALHLKDSPELLCQKLEEVKK